MNPEMVPQLFDHIDVMYPIHVDPGRCGQILEGKHRRDILRLILRQPIGGVIHQGYAGMVLFFLTNVDKRTRRRPGFFVCFPDKARHVDILPENFRE
jgi:hypothetical protein